MRGISNINVTLYDIFGYLMPGLVALGSLVLLAWSFFIPSHPLHEPALSSEEWFAVFVLAYFLGHLVQAIGDLAFWWTRDEKIALDIGEEALGEDRIGGLIKKKAQLKDEHKESFFAYCDTYLAQQGKTADREIYQYREGFYRGLTIALLPAFVAIAIELVRGDASVRNGGGVHTLGTAQLVFACVIVVLAIGLSYFRYRRFSKYRVLDAILGFDIDSQLGAKRETGQS